MSIIKVENLSKKYIIGHDKGAQGMFKYQSLRDTMAHWGRGVYQRLRHPLSPNQESTELEEFWALKDINFEIKQGDRVGIIGRNGAGKSTLLKILSRITEPTTGKITMNGRVASLLEVGTGFHPELTGRENIYLNGAILGMTRVEIKKRFDEIVAFAEVEKFLDTPVKRYSSGMYVRLAFAVAAHLEPEILLVDEVLAVGDAQFQKKCLGKMEDVSKEGRTILFVSHNMAAIQQLCNKGIFLSSGQIKQDDEIDSVTTLYLDTCLSENKLDKGVYNTSQHRNPYGGERIIQNVRISGNSGLSNDFHMGESVNIEVDVSNIPDTSEFGISIFDKLGNRILSAYSNTVPTQRPERTPLKGTFKVSLPNLALYPGLYIVNVSIFTPMVMYDSVADQIFITMHNSDIYHKGINYSGRDLGVFYILDSKIVLTPNGEV